MTRDTRASTLGAAPRRAVGSLGFSAVVGLLFLFVLGWALATSGYFSPNTLIVISSGQTGAGAGPGPAAFVLRVLVASLALVGFGWVVDRVLRRPKYWGRCESCGYDLTGLPGRRCPECGATF